jgi:hypothetical protein
LAPAIAHEARLMPVPISPAAVASLIARNLVPVGGVIFLGWSASNLLVLYFVDTALALAAILLLLVAHVTGLGGKPLAGIVGWVKAVFWTLVAAILIALPLSVPVLILLAQFDWSPLAAFADRGFIAGLVLQTLTSIYGFIQMQQVFGSRAEAEAILKPRTIFVFARWFALVVAAILLPATVFGPRIGGALVLLVYAGASVWFELFPASAESWLLRGKLTMGRTTEAKNTGDRGAGRLD